MGKWRQVRKDAVRNSQGNSAELASVESKNRGGRKKKCSFSRFFITLGSYPPIYIGTLLNESLRGAALERRRPRPIPTFGLMETSLYDKHTHQFLVVYTFYLFPKGSVTKHLARCSGETAYSDVVFPNLQHLVLRFAVAERFR